MLVAVLVVIFGALAVGATGVVGFFWSAIVSPPFGALRRRDLEQRLYAGRAAVHRVARHMAHVELVRRMTTEAVVRTRVERGCGLLKRFHRRIGQLTRANVRSGREAAGWRDSVLRPGCTPHVIDRNNPLRVNSV